MKARNANLELLRILSMLMIVCYHYAIFGFYGEELALSPNKCFVDLFGMWGKLGTDIFVLISGYYLVSSQFKLRRILRMVGTVWFYTIGILLCFVLFAHLRPGRTELKLSFFPLLSSHYWFISFYVLLLLLSPFLNRMLHALDKRMHTALALGLFVLCTVLPEFFHISFAEGSLWLFAALYVCGAWCRLYGGQGHSARRMLIAAALLLLCVGRVVLVDLLGQRSGNMDALIHSTDFMGAYSPFAFALGFLLLRAFASLPPHSWGAVNLLGSLALGVYLFHGNLLISQGIWQQLFHCSEHVRDPLLFLHALGTVLSLYAAGSVIEWLRQKSFGVLWDRLLDRIPGL